MDTSDKVNRLKSVQDSHLGDLTELPEIILDEYRPYTKTALIDTLEDSKLRIDIMAAYNALLEAAKFANQRETIRLGAWRCRTYFAKKQNTVNEYEKYCNTVNGTYAKQSVIRKTCSRCKQFRSHPYITVLEEWNELLIQDGIRSGYSREEAIAKLREQL